MIFLPYLPPELNDMRLVNFTFYSVFFFQSILEFLTKSSFLSYEKNKLTLGDFGIRMHAFVIIRVNNEAKRNET